MEENKAGIHPLGRSVLVLLDPVPEMSEGGIAIPESIVMKDRLGQVRATLVVSGPLAWQELDRHGNPTLTPLRDGARVIIRRYAGEFVTGADGISYRLVNDKDIYATFTDNFPQQD